MPRAKKKNEPTMTMSEARDTFVNCKLYTQDQIKVAVAEVCAREQISTETAEKISNVLDAIVSESFSKVMVSKGF